MDKQKAGRSLKPQLLNVMNGMIKQRKKSLGDRYNRYDRYEKLVKLNWSTGCGGSSNSVEQAYSSVSKIIFESQEK